MKDPREYLSVWGNVLKSREPVFLPLLAKALLISIGLMSIYAAARQWLFPNLAAWPSFFVMIGFSMLLSLLVVLTVFRAILKIIPHRHTVEALRETEERYRSLFSSIPVGLYRTTPEGRIIDANPALVEMLGYPDRETLLAANARDLYVNSEDRLQEQALLEQAGIAENVELQLRRFDGSIIFVKDTVRSIRSSDGQVLYYDGSLEDVTERKRAEEARSLLASIVESSDNAIIGMKLDGTMVSWNSGAEQLFGYSSMEVKGLPISVLAPKDQPDEVAQILEDVRQGKPVKHIETVRVRKDGCQVDVALNLSPIKDTTGKIIGISMIARDITQHKQMEHYVLRTERLAAMGRISAVLAHEVKNPLQAIQSNLELALNFPLEPDERQECLNTCRREVERLIEITQRMLVFARTERLTVRPFPIHRAWQQALSLMEKALEKAAIQVFTDFPEELPPVLGVADQISQVFLNLLLNSIEAMPNGGRLQLSAKAEGPVVVLNMTNNGPPIPEEQIDHLFDPFFTTKPEGTGLGLFICHNIVQQHGGTLIVENRRDETGVVYSLKLPTAQFVPADRSRPA